MNLRTILLPCVAILLVSADPLPNVASQAKKGQCNKIPATGADQTFIGEFAIAEDGTVTGYERRLLFANERWKREKGRDGKVGKDCISHWKVTGKKVAASGCKQCEFGVQFEAHIDYDISTCPMRLLADGNHRPGSYDIERKPNGTHNIYFSRTGNPLGTGYHAGERFNYISSHRCVWF